MTKNKILSILAICLLTTLLCNTNIYAGQLIDKSAKGYILYLPQSTLSGKNSNILVCLPGWGVTAQHDINMWKFPAEKNNFVVIDFDINYERLASLNGAKKIYRQIKQTINSLSAVYPINTQNIYLAGTSAGGMMSIVLSLLYPDEFAAAGIISGARLGFGAKELLKSAKGKKFYLIHGKKDKSISIREFHSTVKQLKKYGAILEFDIIQEGRHTLPSHVYRKVVDWLATK